MQGVIRVLLYLSNAAVPLLIFWIIARGIAEKIPVYDVFIKGAAGGLKTVLQVLPTLVGLMTAVGIMRASGVLELISGSLGALVCKTGFPAELIPLAVVRLFSSSAATGLTLDLYKQYGPDSFLGTAASLLLSSTETVFYTMSVYFMTAGIRKSRYTLVGALTAAAAGIGASVVLAGMMV